MGKHSSEKKRKHVSKKKSTRKGHKKNSSSSSTSSDSNSSKIAAVMKKHVADAVKELMGFVPNTSAHQQVGHHSTNQGSHPWQPSASNWQHSSSNWQTSSSSWQVPTSQWQTSGSNCLDEGGIWNASGDSRNRQRQDHAYRLVYFQHEIYTTKIIHKTIYVFVCVSPRPVYII
jgi:hypothetical protein